jgi:hypothetical protein
MDFETMYQPDSGPDSEGRDRFAKAVRDLIRRGPAGSLAPLQKTPGVGGVVRKRIRVKYEPQIVAALQKVIDEAQKAGLVKASGLTISAPSQNPSNRPLDVIKGIHAAGPERLENQSSNAQWDATRAHDGPLAHDANIAESQRFGQRPKPTLLTPRHSSYMRDLKPLRTQDDGQNDPEATMAAIKVALRMPRQLTPGAIRGDVKNPNRDDAMR